MLKYLSKLALDILPSVAATIIGAYIVNHYIVAKPAVDAPAATAAVTAEPSKPDIKRDVKAAESTPEVTNTPPAGVRAKGIAEKAVFDKSVAEKAVEKTPEKIEDKPAETASIPAETRRHAPREKTVAKSLPGNVPPAVQPAVSAAPATAAAVAANPPVETTTNAPDANDLARAVIERLRGINDRAPRQEAVRNAETPRVVVAPQASAPETPAVRPLPPPIMVSAPPNETFGSPGSSQPQQPNSNQLRVDDPRRPTPPADIPSAAPFDLRAAASESQQPREPGNVAQDMLSAAKSVFHAVLPQ